jgi:peroxiredoxin
MVDVEMGRFDAMPRSAPISVGDRAPDLSLRRTFGETVALSDRLAVGPVVLVFYVFDFGHY